MSLRPNTPKQPVPRYIAPQHKSPGAVYVRQGGGGGGNGWIIATIVLLLFATAGGAYYLKRNGGDTVVVVEAPSKSFQLAKIEEQPEKDGERPIEPDATFNDDDFHFLPEENDTADDPTPAAAAAAAEEKEAPIPKGITRKEIALVTPGLTGVPADRVVDILCVFTTNYKNRYGGKGQKTMNVTKRITEMFEESNHKWQGQNGKQVAVRIVGVVETDYVDSWQVNDLNALNRGHITTVAGTPVHKLRAKLGADMIVLFGTKGGGGVSSGNAYFIVKRGHGIFTHECQHAFGWGHGEQLPDGKGDDVSKLAKTAPGRSGWMPKKTKDGKIYVEYRGV
jgi:hypothetical protein